MAVNEPPNTESESKERMTDNEILNWDDYFMVIAFLSAKRSKDPVTRVGACIVNKEKRIISTGYNGMPNGCPDKDFPWTKVKPSTEFNSKAFYVCHAELNAILNNNTTSIKGCTIYVGLFPCNECAKMIIQSGIEEIIYMSDKHYHKKSTMASKRMLTAAGVKFKQHEPINRQINIDLDDVDRKKSEMEKNQPTPEDSQSRPEKKKKNR